MYIFIFVSYEVPLQMETFLLQTVFIINTLIGFWILFKRCCRLSKHKSVMESDGVIALVLFILGFGFPLLWCICFCVYSSSDDDMARVFAKVGLVLFIVTTILSVLSVVLAVIIIIIVYVVIIVGAVNDDDY
ncbi:hypothetical protein EDI_020640 [Entamoeba dispar SAW760]|uniref:Uncharacterized protein n=1 Tax=Entamoeba dispar (strain ATCC PRA-260 / SAW760) TaxID=370354 RepID=B0EU11_ENTDS|nr:uncharacterized protein EDI_020640 [Entamoeba dispar SAW760]EDR21980.1 hypothetical protein EDI_020640 [Entamoeba dispar SAW760]|eukprot:EDR21980.1 hypothetical protein EDI_020640 [Entamoeba dispar SAW760]